VLAFLLVLSAGRLSAQEAAGVIGQLTDEWGGVAGRDGVSIEPVASSPAGDGSDRRARRISPDAAADWHLHIRVFAIGTTLPLRRPRCRPSGSDADIPVRGIAINAIIKSGGNSFHGGAFYAGTSENFQSNNITSELAAQGITTGNPIESRNDLNGELGGRIVKDKLWFYTSGRSRRETDDIVQCFQRMVHRASSSSYRASPRRDRPAQRLQLPERRDRHLAEHPVRTELRDSNGHPAAADLRAECFLPFLTPERNLCQ